MKMSLCGKSWRMMTHTHMDGSGRRVMMMVGVVWELVITGELNAHLHRLNGRFAHILRNACTPHVTQNIYTKN